MSLVSYQKITMPNFNINFTILNFAIKFFSKFLGKFLGLYQKSISINVYK